MLFDTHAHYDDEAFNADRDALLTALPDRGVGLVIDPGCDLASSRRAVELAAAYPHVYAAVGIHAENCGGCTDDDLAALRPLAQQPLGDPSHPRKDQGRLSPPDRSDCRRRHRLFPDRHH